MVTVSDPVSRLSQKSTFDVVKSERRLAEVIHEREVVQEEVRFLHWYCDDSQRLCLAGNSKTYFDPNHVPQANLNERRANKRIKELEAEVFALKKQYSMGFSAGGSAPGQGVPEAAVVNINQKLNEARAKAQAAEDAQKLAEDENKALKLRIKEQVCSRCICDCRYAGLTHRVLSTTGNDLQQSNPGNQVPP